MSTPSHQPATATTQAGLSSPHPAATRQGAALPNILQIPMVVIAGWAVFDCRTGDELAGTVKAPWGETLWGSERAAYSIGLRNGWSGDDTSPCSLSGCPDLRRWPEQYDRVANDLVREAERLMRDWKRALANPAAEGDGGSVYYRPVAVAVCNFGGTVIADRRTAAVRRFMF